MVSLGQCLKVKFEKLNFLSVFFLSGRGRAARFWCKGVQLQIFGPIAKNDVDAAILETSDKFLEKPCPLIVVKVIDVLFARNA